MRPDLGFPTPESIEDDFGFVGRPEEVVVAELRLGLAEWLEKPSNRGLDDLDVEKEIGGTCAEISRLARVHIVDVVLTFVPVLRENGFFRLAEKYTWLFSDRPEQGAAE